MSEPLTPVPSWYYNPEAWWVKLLRFLHLLEDELVQLSHTGISLWVTTLNNLHGLAFSVDPVTVGGGILANVASLWAHTAKRAQVINAKQETP